MLSIVTPPSEEISRLGGELLDDPAGTARDRVGPSIFQLQSDQVEKRNNANAGLEKRDHLLKREAGTLAFDGESRNR
jgi:hypothetical protein